MSAPSTPHATPPLDLTPQALGVAKPLMFELDRLVQRIVTLHAEFTQNQVHRLRAELSMTNRVLDECQRELEWLARMRVSRLAGAGSFDNNVLEWNPTMPARGAP